MTTDPANDVRARLVDAAIRLLAEGGPESLQARKVATETGASTMAVYTHFGGMGALIQAVSHEGFRQLSQSLGRIAASADPVADIFAMGYAYRQTAVDNPNLYAVTFGLSAPGGKRAQARNVTEDTATAVDDRKEAFNHLVGGAARAIDAGRFRPGNPQLVASQLWSALHGYVTLEISGHFGSETEGVGQVLQPLGVTLALGLGDSPQAAAHSREVAADTWSQASGNTGTTTGDTV